MTNQAGAPEKHSGRSAWSKLSMILGILVLAGVGLWAVAEVTEDTAIVTQTVAVEGVARIVVSGEASNITVAIEDRSDIEVTSELSSSLWSKSTTRSR